MRTQWNDAEDEALQGLTPEAQVIYLRGFRRYMDYRTGVAGGPARRLSYRALAELITPDPDWGSRRPRGESPSLGQIRARVAELERAGLIVNYGSSRAAGLVFFLPLADAGSVCPEKEQHEEQHKEQQLEQHCGKVLNLLNNMKNPECRNGRNDTGNDIGNNTRNNTHLYNYTELNSTDAGARVNDAWPDAYRPARPEEWGSFLGRERQWAYHRVSRPKLIVTYQHWTRLGLSIGDMRQIMASAEANLGRIPDGPEYYRPFAESYARERDRLQQQNQRGTYGAGSSDRISRSQRDKQAAVRKQLTDPAYALEHW